MNARLSGRPVAPPGAGDEPMFRDPSRAFLKIVIGFMLAGSTAFLIALFAFAPDQTARALVVTTLMLLSGIAWFLESRGRIAAAILTLAGGTWTYVSVTAFFFGGVDGVAIIVYVPIILLIGCLVGARAAVAVAGSAVATTLGFVIADAWGVLPVPPPTSPVMRWVVEACVFIVSAVLIVSAVRSHRSRLEDVGRLGSALAQRTADLDRAQAVAHVGSWVYDLATDTMHLSAETCRIFGLPEGTTGSHDTYLSRVYPEDRDAVKGAWQVALAGGAPFDNEHRIVIGQTVRWIRQIAELQRGADGTPLRSVGTTQDITERTQAESALVESRNLLKTIIDTAPVRVFWKDRDLRYLGCNPAFARDAGASGPTELIGRDDHQLAWADQADDYRADDRAVIDSGVAKLAYEERQTTPDGQQMWLRTSKVPLRRHDNETIGILGVYEDITESKRVERRLNMAIEISQVVLWEIDLVNDRLTFDHAMLPMLGLAADDAPDTLGRWIARIHPDDRAAFQGRVERAMQPGDPVFDVEYRMTGQAGDCQWIHTRGRVVQRDAGRLPALAVGTSMNITARTRADEALRESENRLAAVFNASPIGIVIGRLADGTILDANAAALSMYGYRRDEAIGRTVIELGVYDDPMQHEDVVQQLRDTGDVDRHPINLRNKNGDISIVEVSVRVIELQGEQCLVVMMLDVTDRKRLEQAHLQAEKLASLGTLAGGIAHDFNNILAAICGNTDLAAEDVGPDHVAAESLGEIRKASRRATDLVRRIMAFARPKETRHEVVDLAVVAVEVLKLLRSTLPAGISLRTAFAEHAPHVLADAGQVHEVLVNLTTNAAYAIGSRIGSIEYRLEPVQVDEKLARSVPGLNPGGYARLTVADSGCGMDAETLDRIFDAFYTTKPVGEGTGLGLSMVHGIMRSHGGAVTVQSSPGTGATFALYFPAVERQARQEPTSARAPDQPVAERRVLFVDDEEAMVFLANRVFARLGYRVAGFTDAKEALAVFRAHPHDYEIVVTDLSMPLMSGFDLAREVLALRPDMPVLVASGFVRPEDEATARSIGIRALVLKPIAIDQLGQMLDRLFRGGG